MNPPLRPSPAFASFRLAEWVAKALLASLAAALTLAASQSHAQKVHRVAALVAEHQFLRAYDGFRSKMSEIGYIEQKNIRYQLFNARGDLELLKGLAETIVQQKPDLIVTSSTTATVPVAKLTERSNLPVVFLTAGNPLKLVKSYSSSGNNLTGISTSVMELTEKRLALFRDLIPRSNRLIFITNSRSSNYEEYVTATREAAKRLRFVLTEIELKAGNGEEVQKQLDRVTRKAGEGLIVPPDAVFVAAAEFIGRHAVKEKLPSVGPNVQTVGKGLLAVYSADYYALGQQGAKLVDKILRGAKPSDIPVEQPYRLQLAVNMKVANAIGLKVPREIVLQADELIE